MAMVQKEKNLFLASTGWSESRFAVVHMESNTIIIIEEETVLCTHNWKPTFAPPSVYTWITNIHICVNTVWIINLSFPFDYYYTSIYITSLINLIFLPFWLKAMNNFEAEFLTQKLPVFCYLSDYVLKNSSQCNS